MASTVARFLIEVIKHPLTQKLAQHAIRVGSAALIRHLRTRTRTG
jgi:hypothetical protein